MNTCETHKQDLFGEPDMKKVAEAIGDLHYKTLAELLGRLAVKILQDCYRDKLGGRTQLSYALDDAAENIKDAALHIEQAWIISKPFMTKKTNKP